MSFVLCTSSDNCFIFVSSLGKYLKGFVSYCADTISIVKLAKEHNSVKNIDGIKVLIFCTFSDDALNLYQIS